MLLENNVTNSSVIFDNQVNVISTLNKINHDDKNYECIMKNTIMKFLIVKVVF